MSITKTLVKVEGISKSFPGVLALNNVDFELKPGTVHALMGENGAGKSTLVKVMMGIYTRDSGKMWLKGNEVNFKSPRDALNAGMSFIPQELCPVPDMTIAENIWLGRENSYLNIFVDYKTLNKKTEDLLSRIDVKLDPKRLMKTLSTAEVQLIEIAKAISLDNDVLIMDEPTSAIGEKEVDKLFEIVRLLKEQGKGIVYVSHRMEEIFAITDEITVFRDGKMIGSVLTKDITRGDLISLMIGTTLDQEYYKKNVPTNEVLLESEDLTIKGKCENISLSVKKGEILGLFGLVGAGRSEFFDALFGVVKKEKGSVRIKGKEVKIKSPADAIRNGMALVTEDRKETGLVLSSSVKDNTSIASIKQDVVAGLINRSKELERVNSMIDKFKVKTPSERQFVSNLSGGNQQKVVLGRWVLTNPKILLLDEPTRGIDVGAKREIYKFMSDFAASGNAIIMISSEIPEVLGMSDRIIVLKDHKIVAEKQRDEIDQELLMHLASYNK